MVIGKIVDWLITREYVYGKLLPGILIKSGSLRWRLRERAQRLRLGKCGDGGYLQDTVVVDPSNVVVGSRVTFGGHVLIVGTGWVSIGSDCMLAYGAVLMTASHDPNTTIMNTAVRYAPISIGQNVWIGVNAIILPGVSIADGVVVGAGALVNRSINESNVIVGGVPARVIRSRIS